jgi:hypothetical protein
MQFEKVHTIRDIYDGIRSGTADLSGAPHYFASLFDDKMDDYTQHFRLYAVSAQFMERELRHWAVYRTWEASFIEASNLSKRLRVMAASSQSMMN